MEIVKIVGHNRYLSTKGSHKECSFTSDLQKAKPYKSAKAVIRSLTRSAWYAYPTDGKNKSGAHSFSKNYFEIIKVKIVIDEKD